MIGPDDRRSREGGARLSRHGRSVVLVALAVAFSIVAVPALAEVAPSDIQAATAAAEGAAGRLDDARGDLAAAERRLERLRESRASVLERLARKDDEIAVGRAAARDRIARMYMTAGASDGGSLLGLDRITDLPAHLAYLAALADQDREFVNGLATTRSDLRRLQDVVETEISGQQAEVAALEDVVEARRADLESALERVAAVEAEWQRQEEERRAREEAARLRQLEEERRRVEAEEQARREEEARKAAAVAALQAAAASAAAAGWSPGAGVEPWRPLVEKHFPPGLVDDALSVMYCESKGDPLAVNRYSAAAGLFQHLPFYWPSRSAAAGWAGADVFDPEANIAVAAWLVNRTIVVERREPWGHWVCKP